MVGAKPDCTSAGEKGLNGLDRGRIVRGAILRNHHGGIADVEIHIARRDDFAVALDQARRGDRDHLQLRVEQRLGGIGISGGVGILLDRFGNGDPSRGNEARQIVDMPIGMIVDQALAKPDDPRRAKVAPQARFHVVLAQGRIAVWVEQALFGGEQHACPVAVDRASFEDPVGFRI